MPKIPMLGSRLSSLDPTKALRSINTLKPYGSHRPRGDTWMAIRERIMIRDRYTCQHCKTVHIPSELEVDHRIPLFEGGKSDDGNLQTLCIPCHKAKSAKEKGRANVAMRD